MTSGSGTWEAKQTLASVPARSSAHEMWSKPSLQLSNAAYSRPKLGRVQESVKASVQRERPKRAPKESAQAREAARLVTHPSPRSGKHTVSASASKQIVTNNSRDRHLLAWERSGTPPNSHHAGIHARTRPRIRALSKRHGCGEPRGSRRRSSYETSPRAQAHPPAATHPENQLKRQTRCAPLPLVGRGWGWGSE